MLRFMFEPSPPPMLSRSPRLEGGGLGSKDREWREWRFEPGARVDIEMPGWVWVWVEGALEA